MARQITPPLPEPPAALIAQMTRGALQEDIGAGDLSAPLAMPGVASASLICREQAVLCGVAWFEQCFRQLDGQAAFNWTAQDGATISPGATLCRIRAQAAALLTAERSALNFLQTLSGTATAAQQWRAAAGERVKIVDTRKTLPLWRLAQKYAVRVGGGDNHRMGLYDEILIKENHIRVAGGIAAALKKAKRLRAAANAPAPQIEARNLDELRQAIAAGATRVLLDNFSRADLKQAVNNAPPEVELEASGGITLDTVGDIAATGVHRISVGALTKNVRAVDFSLLLDEPNEPDKPNG